MNDRYGPRVRAETPPTPLKVAVIGAGHMANKVHYPNLASFKDVQIAGICDRNVEKLRATADKYGVEKVYTNYRKMIEASAPDAILAIGHPHTMYDVWMWCLHHAQNLFIEKPMGLTLHQARGLAHVAASNGCVTQVCFQRRASPLLQLLATACKKRGAVTYAAVDFTKNTPQPFLGARDHMFDDGIHAIDTLRYICEGEVVNLRCIMRRVGVPDINFILAWLEFDSGAVGQMHCNWASGYRAFRVAIHGPSICAQGDLEASARLHVDGDTLGSELGASQVAGSDDAAVYCGFRAKLAEFFACVRSNTEPSSNFSDALKTHIVAEKLLALDLLGRA